MEKTGKMLKMVLLILICAAFVFASMENVYAEKLPTKPLKPVKKVPLKPIKLPQAWLKIISTPRYCQQRSNWCGAGSAQMILNSSLIRRYVRQSVLWNYIRGHNHCRGWATDPYGMRDCLRHYDTRPGFTYNIFANPYCYRSCQKLCYTIDRYGVPPAVLVYGGAHWIVVVGTYTSRRPTPERSSYRIYGFWVHDPWCAAGTLGRYRYIAYWDWCTNKFTRIPSCFAGKRVSVVDPDPPGPELVRAPKVPAKRPTIISPEEAKKVALEGLKSHKLVDQPGFKQALRRGRPGDPILVAKADEESEPYYIVAWVSKGRAFAAVIVGALTGRFKEASYVKKAAPYLKLTARIAKSLFQQKIPIAKKVRTPALMWRFSEQSRSPYYPIYAIKATVRGKAVTQYMDFEKKLYKALHVPKKVGG